MTTAESKDGRSIDELACYHNDWRDRCWTATYTRPEIEAALKSGYIVTKVFRALDFDEWDSELFKGYVKKFLKVLNFINKIAINFTSFDRSKQKLPDGRKTATPNALMTELESNAYRPRI